MDYRLELKVKNNNILKMLEKNGYKSVGHFCRENNKLKWQGILGEFVNLKRSPLNSKGKYHPIILGICDILGCDIEDLFSSHQLNTALETNKRTIEVKEAEAIFSLSYDAPILLPDEILEQKETEIKVNRILKTLAPREEKIIKKLYGLDGEGQYTLDEVGALFDISRERVRQIEAKAVRKLRHPSRSKIFKTDLL